MSEPLPACTVSPDPSPSCHSTGIEPADISRGAAGGSDRRLSPLCVPRNKYIAVVEYGLSGESATSF